MSNRVVPFVLVVVLVILHAQMWFGRGSIPNVAELQRKVNLQKAANTRATQQNEQLASEVEDLKAGLGMVEEKARFELGMVKPNEIFVQVLK